MSVLSVIAHCIPVSTEMSPGQWSLYFKTTHGAKKMWSYIAGGRKRKVI